MPDVTLYCSDCNRPFLFKYSEQQFFASKNIVNPPERCPTCRAQKKARQAQERNQAMTLTCSDCNQTFVFTKGEQEFYEEKGIPVPIRCKPCRERHKQERQNNSSGHTQPGQPRKMYDHICAICGTQFEEPFPPKPHISSYCRNCGPKRYDGVCTDCGRPIRMLHPPIPGRPNYCGGCHMYHE